MTEISPEFKEYLLDPEWKRVISVSIDEALENYETFLPLDFSPISLTTNHNSQGALDDPRAFHEISLNAQEFIIQTLFNKINFIPEVGKFIDSYQSPFYPLDSEEPDPDRQNQVTIYETGRSADNIYLHKIEIPDQRIEYIVAPKDFRL